MVHAHNGMQKELFESNSNADRTEFSLSLFVCLSKTLTFSTLYNTYVRCIEHELACHLHGIRASTFGVWQFSHSTFASSLCGFAGNCRRGGARLEPRGFSTVMTVHQQTNLHRPTRKDQYWTRPHCYTVYSNDRSQLVLTSESYQTHERATGRAISPLDIRSCI